LISIKYKNSITVLPNTNTNITSTLPFKSSIITRSQAKKNKPKLSQEELYEKYGLRPFYIDASKRVSTQSNSFSSNSSLSNSFLSNSSNSSLSSSSNSSLSNSFLSNLSSSFPFISVPSFQA
jgi:hypothetical protein